MKIISAEALKRKMDKNEVLVVDVREPVEYRGESIPGACLIPFGEINIQKLPSTSKPLIMYCKSGKRSTDACNKLLAADSSLDVSSLEGGIVAWKKAGFDIQRGSSKVIPLERQNQIVAGSMAFTGVILGAFVNQAFYILPGFVGAGLVFAGMTGWCGMMKLLSKMPWNK